MTSAQIVPFACNRVASAGWCECCGGLDRRDQTSGAEPIEQRVVDAALAIATEVGWEQVGLSTIADQIQLPLAKIGRHFRDTDAIANAWFARARLAMLALPAEELAGRPADERIALAFGTWLDSLPASPGRGRDPPPQALSLPSAPLGADDLRPVAAGARLLDLARVLVRPVAAVPGGGTHRHHPHHLGGLAPGRQPRPGV